MKKQKMDKRKIVRTYSAGVFFGEVVKRTGKEVVMRNARRLWFWSGAASLSQLATTGTSNHGLCKFPAPMPELTITDAIEIIGVTVVAAASIDGVPTWTA